MPFPPSYLPTLPPSYLPTFLLPSLLTGLTALLLLSYMYPLSPYPPADAVAVTITIDISRA